MFYVYDEMSFVTSHKPENRATYRCDVEVTSCDKQELYIHRE